MLREVPQAQGPSPEEGRSFLLLAGQPFWVLGLTLTSRHLVGTSVYPFF